MIRTLKKLLRIKTDHREGKLIYSFLGFPVRVKAFNSAEYWEQRYKKGGNSGSGSYGRLAEFKAEVINGFIAKKNITSVIEFGTGDGNQLSLLQAPSYTGFDISDTVLHHVRERFKDEPGKRFFHVREYLDQKADLALSLDVIYHLVEDDIFAAYMERLFDAAEKYVIIYASNKDEYSEAIHVRHRPFVSWILENRQDWLLLEQVKNRHGYDDTSDPKHSSFADFYVFGHQSTIADQ